MTETKTNNPHDKFFKKTFSRLDVVQNFCQYYLPSEIRDLLDLSTLSPAKDNFVDSENREQFSDLLYTVKLKSGWEIYLFLLFEHKSYPDRFTLLQLMSYEVEILKLDRKVKKKKRLPPILPLVIYHGKRKWKAPLEIRELFPAIPGLEPYLPQLRCLLLDLSVLEEEKIQGDFILRTTLYLLKFVQHTLLPYKLGKIDEWVSALGKKRKPYQEFIEDMLDYLYYGTDKVSPEQIQEELKEVMESRGDMKMPTPAEGLLERGKQEGRLDDLYESLVENLEIRFDRIPLPIREKVLKIKEIDRLRKLRKQALMVDSLADFETLLNEKD